MTKTIQKATGKYLSLKRSFPYIIENASLLRYSSSEQDIAAINKSGYFYEFEVKISRQDFLKDKKKGKWNYSEAEEKAYVLRKPNYFSYVCPVGLIDIEEIPIFSGLYYFENDNIIEIRKPKIIHKEKQDINRIITTALRMYSERTFLGYCYMTYKNKQVKGLL